MKKDIKDVFLSIVICISLSIHSQDYKEFDCKIDSLENEKEILNKRINSLDSEIWNIKQLKLKRIKEDTYSKGVEIFAKTETPLYSGRGTWYDEVAIIPSGTRILAYDLTSSYYFIDYDTISGYAFIQDVETVKQKTERIRIKEEKEKRRLEEIRKEEALRQQWKREQAERKERLKKKYGDINGEKIFNGYIWLGMTKEMIIDSWGETHRINRSVGVWGVHEQWIYSGSYLYIDNGILTSWQD